MRLMSDSVLHFSDSRFPALQEIVWAETGRGWRSSPARWETIALRKHSRFRYPLPIRLIHWVRGLIDSAASFGQSITTASRNAVNREPRSAHRVVARTRPATLRTARLAVVRDEDLDRAGRNEFVGVG